MTEDELLAHSRALIESFLQRNTRKDEHRVRLFREISRCRLGQDASYASPEVAFKFLACDALYVHMQCSQNPSHYRRNQPWQYCGLRFFCDACARYEKKHRAEEWLRLVRWVMSASHLHPRQAVKLEWPLPDVKDARNLSRFSDYLHRVWRPALASQGIPPTQWMLTVAVNPIMGIVRGLYLGPSVAPVVGMENGEKDNAPLVRMERRNAAIAPLVPSRVSLLATTGAWKPRQVHSIELLSKNSPNFGTVLLPALLWVTESDVKPSDLEPSAAMELDCTYYRRRLYSVHGAIYGVKRISELDPEPEKDHVVEAGRFQDRCPECNARLEITCETRLPADL
jgi:hypothetical protein